MHDLNELYRQTKAAEARAARHGLLGTAAALAGVARLLTEALAEGADVGPAAQSLACAVGAPAPEGGRCRQPVLLH